MCESHVKSAFCAAQVQQSRSCAELRQHAARLRARREPRTVRGPRALLPFLPHCDACACVFIRTSVLWLHLVCQQPHGASEGSGEGQHR